ncbi:MAG TPA: transcriptional regulator, partial [Mycobacterium sp.]|nr:transcriptional regulator [Mycobacterium sp.]
EILTEALAADRDPRSKAMAAGRAWGRNVELAPEPSAPPTSAEDAIDRLVGVLDELGFAPERRTSDGRQLVGLRHCPFLELAETRGGVVCPIHLGLMQGALETMAAPVTVDRLDAFVEPDLCLAHLKPVGAGR